MGWENAQLVERLAGAQRGQFSGVLSVHGPAAKLEIHLVAGSPAYVGNALGGRGALDDRSVELMERCLDWTKVVMSFTAKDPSVLRIAPSRLLLERLVSRAIRDHYDSENHSGVREVPSSVPGRRVEARRAEDRTDSRPTPPSQSRLG